MADAANFDRKMACSSGEGASCRWLTIPHPDIRVGGLGFWEQEQAWNRLPLALSPMLRQQRPALLELARHMAGACLDFVTDSPEIWVRAKVDSAAYMSHMTPAAQCGFDCYARLPDGRWVFAGVTKFPVDQREFCCCLAQNLPPHSQIRIHLPLYIGVEEIQVGLAQEASLQLPPPFLRKAVAIYGTSITQGGCASHSGMAYPALLSRMLDAPVYNLGFSGNGVGLPQLAEPFCSLPQLGALVVDIEANAAPEGLLEQNLPLFLDEVRRCAPKLPVLVLSAALRPAALWDSGLAKADREAADFQRQEVERRRAAGDEQIQFADARQLIGPVGEEATVDGRHLTDLGFYAMAQGLFPLLDTLLH